MHPFATEMAAPVEPAVMATRERNLGMACHLAALLGVLFPAVFLISIAGPLVLWLMHRDELPFVASQGAESINFQITMTILYLACYPLMLILIGFPLLVTLKFLNLLLVVMAAVKIGAGTSFRYPFNLRFIG
jgi:uncharacterized Tic20 family protein